MEKLSAMYGEKTRKLVLCLILGLLFQNLGLSQSDDDQPKFTLDGYVKQLTSVISSGDPDTYFMDLLFHNRLNSTWYISDKFTFHGDLRTRLFIGDQVRLNPFFPDAIDMGSNDYLDLSSNLWQSDGAFLHSYLDRFFLEYRSDKWEVRLGRQRINWGITIGWNPNDIFNAYSFTDFDYEERPGSDALRARYFYGHSSSVEVGIQAADEINKAAAAFLWKFNMGSYDIQILTGLKEEDIVLGLGWAGNIKYAGWKGEMSYFLPTDSDMKSAFSTSVNFDYAFNNGIYWNVGMLYNSEGGVTGGLDQLFQTELSARNLYPFRWSILSMQSATISPLISAAVTVVYSPVKSNALFLSPTVTVSIASNWDLDLISQIVFESKDKSYKSPIQAYFLRLKHSF